MNHWPPRPVIYEVHTRLWLSEWRQRRAHTVQPDYLPEDVGIDFRFKGIDAVWFMGVWELSELASRLLWEVPEIKNAYPNGISASPYSIKDYKVAKELGGQEGWTRIRESLKQHGMRVILDFVPNHTAPDHPWTEKHPEFFVSGNGLAPEQSILCGDRLLAKGRDPFYPPWPDVVQLNAFHEGYREKAVSTLLGIAEMCDGVRCDMAMLLLNDVFENTWGTLVKERPREEFWSYVISRVKEKYPSFCFLAEVYWGRERDLWRLGFDYCYDKKLYDILLRTDIAALRDHLAEPVDYQEHLLRFLENHDEERAAYVFPSQQLKAANVITSTLPGALLFHHGQWEGKRWKVPVYAPALPPEEPVAELEAFYRWLSTLKGSEIFKKGTWACLPPFQVWPDNRSGENLIAWMWSHEKERLLVVVNYSASSAQGRLPLPFEGASNSHPLGLVDLSTGISYPRRKGELASFGLFVDLPPWGYHLFHFYLD